MKRKYSNNVHVFRYICGSFTPTAQRQSINDLCKGPALLILKSSLQIKTKHGFHIKSVQAVWKP